MVYCDPETDPETWSGFEVELFKRVADKLDWPMQQMEWKCLDWSTVEDNLIAGDGSCDVSPMGLPPRVEYIQQGIVFSWPTYENGLAVAVSNDQAVVSMWAFLDAFTWQLWVLIIATALGVGFVVFAVDAWIFGAKYDKKKKQILVGGSEKDGLSSGGQEVAFADYIWDAVMRPTQVRDQKPLSFASNFIVLAFAFMMLVIVTVYTANTTANITATRLQSTIRGIQDLPGKVTGTWEDFVPDLAKLGVQALGLPWETQEDEAAMLELLRNGTIQALVLDTAFLIYTASSSCEIAVVGQEFNRQNSAIAFASDFNSPELLKEVNQALSELREDGAVDVLVNTFIDPPAASCKTSLIDETSTKITVNQLAGLWVMLVVGIGAAIVIAIIYKLHVRYTQKHIKKAGSQIKRKVSLVITKQLSGRRTYYGRTGSLSSDGGEETSQESADVKKKNTINEESRDIV